MIKYQLSQKFFVSIMVVYNKVVHFIHFIEGFSKYRRQLKQSFLDDERMTSSTEVQIRIIYVLQYIKREREKYYHD
jgi:hypothetical protein